MTRDADRLAMLETQVQQLQEQLSQQQRPMRRRAPSRTRRTMLVIGLALALVITPAIALAAHQFGDVPNSNPFHTDIAALVNSGVTAGCGGGNYCPKAEVTREQMAAFLNRLGALAPDKTPVVNAAKLDGYHANELVRVARGSTRTSPLCWKRPETTYGSVSITAPAAGFVLVTAAPTAFNSGCTPTAIHHRVRHAQTGSHSIDAVATAWGVRQPSGARRRSAGSSRSQPAPTRSSLGCTARRRRRHSLFGYFNALTALYTPFGNTGGGTLAFDEVPPSEPMPLPTE
jgi:hypothetical protein